MNSWKDSWNANAVQQDNESGNGRMPSASEQPLNCNSTTSNPWMTCMKKYATFTGRARRREYWGFVLMNNFLCLIAMIMYGAGISAVAGNSSKGDLEVFVVLGIAAFLIYQLVVMLPTFAVMVRRLHDIGHSGWFMLICLIPYVGPIVFLVFMLLDSQPGENAYGPDPKIGG